MTRLTCVKEQRILAKQRTNSIRVTACDRLEPAEGEIPVSAIDLRLERTPARKAMVLRNGEQRISQPGVRIGPPEVRQRCDYFLFPSPTNVGNRIFSLKRLSSSIVQYHSPISTRGRDEYRIGLPTHGFV